MVPAPPVALTTREDRDASIIAGPNVGDIQGVVVEHPEDTDYQPPTEGVEEGVFTEGENSPETVPSWLQNFTKESLTPSVPPEQAAQESVAPTLGSRTPTAEAVQVPVSGQSESEDAPEDNRRWYRRMWDGVRERVNTARTLLYLTREAGWRVADAWLYQRNRTRWENFWEQFDAGTGYRLDDAERARISTEENRFRRRLSDEEAREIAQEEKSRLDERYSKAPGWLTVANQGWYRRHRSLGALANVIVEQRDQLSAEERESRREARRVQNARNLAGIRAIFQPREAQQEIDETVSVLNIPEVKRAEMTEEEIQNIAVQSGARRTLSLMERLEPDEQDRYPIIPVVMEDREDGEQDLNFVLGQEDLRSFTPDELEQLASGNVTLEQLLEQGVTPVQEAVSFEESPVIDEGVTLELDYVSAFREDKSLEEPETPPAPVPTPAPVEVDEEVAVAEAEPVGEAEAYRELVRLETELEMANRELEQAGSGVTEGEDGLIIRSSPERSMVAELKAQIKTVMDSLANRENKLLGDVIPDYEGLLSSDVGAQLYQNNESFYLEPANSQSIARAMMEFKRSFYANELPAIVQQDREVLETKWDELCAATSAFGVELPELATVIDLDSYAEAPARIQTQAEYYASRAARAQQASQSASVEPIPQPVAAEEQVVTAEFQMTEKERIAVINEKYNQELSAWKSTGLIEFQQDKGEDVFWNAQTPDELISLLEQSGCPTDAIDELRTYFAEDRTNMTPAREIELSRRITRSGMVRATAIRMVGFPETKATVGIYPEARKGNEYHERSLRIEQLRSVSNVEALRGELANEAQRLNVFLSRERLARNAEVVDIPDVPTVIIRDVHARPDVIPEALIAHMDNMGVRGTRDQLLAKAKEMIGAKQLAVVLLGDYAHSESPNNWEKIYSNDMNQIREGMSDEIADYALVVNQLLELKELAYNSGNADLVTIIRGNHDEVNPPPKNYLMKGMRRSDGSTMDVRQTSTWLDCLGGKESSVAQMLSVMESNMPLMAYNRSKRAVFAHDVPSIDRSKFERLMQRAGSGTATRALVNFSDLSRDVVDGQVPPGEVNNILRMMANIVWGDDAPITLYVGHDSDDAYSSGPAGAVSKANFRATATSGTQVI